MRAKVAALAVNVVAIAAGLTVAILAGVHFHTASGVVPPPRVRAPHLSQLSYLGVYEPASPHSYAGVERFSRLIGRRPNIAVYYSSWWEPFQVTFARAAEKHRALVLVQIEPRDVSLAAIASGDYDRYLRAFARSVRALKYPVVISFGHEMNANWYGWGYRHTTPTVFIAAWRHMYRLFGAVGVQNVRWLWTVNVVGGPDVSAIARWWPGSAYVTWVGIDGHYFTPSIRFASLFGATLGQVRRLTDAPVLIAEAGIAPFVATSRIADLFSGARAHGLLGVVWFDVKGSNLRIENNPHAIAIFRQAIRNYLQTAHIIRRPSPAHSHRSDRPA